MVGKQEPLNFILTSRVQPSLCYMTKCYHQKVKFICLDYMKRVGKYMSLPVPRQEYNYIYSRFIRSGKTEAMTEYTQLSTVPCTVVNNIYKREVQKRKFLKHPKFMTYLFTKQPISLQQFDQHLQHFCLLSHMAVDYISCLLHTHLPN